MQASIFVRDDTHIAGWASKYLYCRRAPWWLVCFLIRLEASSAALFAEALPIQSAVRVPLSLATMKITQCLVELNMSSHLIQEKSQLRVVDISPPNSCWIPRGHKGTSSEREPEDVLRKTTSRDYSADMAPVSGTGIG